MKNSVTLNLYSQVLKKKGRLSFDKVELNGQKIAFVNYLAGLVKTA